MAQFIQTERLLVRKPVLSDAKACAVSLNDLSVSKWLGMVPHPYLVTDAEEFITEYATDFPKAGFIFSDGTLVGGIGIDSELGYWLAPPAWGLGFATEAATGMLDYYFKTTDVQAVLSSYHEGNARSQNVLNKLGFKPSKTRKNTPKSTGVEVTLFEVSLSRADWEARA